LSGGIGAVEQEDTIKKIGSYSLKLTRNGADCTVYSSPYASEEAGADYFKGRKVTAGCWVYATVADRARINVYDGVGATYSSYHTGDSTWQWLTVTHTVDNSTTGLRCRFVLNTGDTSAYFDGAMLVEGESAFAFSDKPAGEGVWTDYSATSTIVGWSSFTTKEIYTKKIGNKKIIYV